jgi:hypothetical protein
MSSGVDDIYVHCQEHFADWLRMICVLSREQQEVLFRYYLLGKTQIVLSKLLQHAQTVCSFRIRMAVKLAGTYLMMGGAELRRQPFQNAPFEYFQRLTSRRGLP